jgi:hypothetical protein
VYNTGDYVYLAGLPRRVLCRVAQAESTGTGSGAFQILTLEPLEGPWRGLGDTEIVRFDDGVLPAGARDLWAANGDAHP